jgi:hypothetical protein
MKQAASYLLSYLAYLSTLKIEATCYSETSVDFNGLHVTINQKTELYFPFDSYCVRHLEVRGLRLKSCREMDVFLSVCVLYWGFAMVQSYYILVLPLD